MLRISGHSANNAARLLEVDDFIADLWKVHQAVKKEGYVQVDTYAELPTFAELTCH
jgi:hypothetical protein